MKNIITKKGQLSKVAEKAILSGKMFFMSIEEFKALTANTWSFPISKEWQGLTEYKRRPFVIRNNGGDTSVTQFSYPVTNVRYGRFLYDFECDIIRHNCLNNYGGSFLGTPIAQIINNNDGKVGIFVNVDKLDQFVKFITMCVAANTKK